MFNILTLFFIVSLYQFIYIITIFYQKFICKEMISISRDVTGKLTGPMLCWEDSPAGTSWTTRCRSPRGRRRGRRTTSPRRTTWDSPVTTSRLLKGRAGLAVQWFLSRCGDSSETLPMMLVLSVKKTHPWGPFLAFLCVSMPLGSL